MTDVTGSMRCIVSIGKCRSSPLQCEEEVNKVEDETEEIADDENDAGILTLAYHSPSQTIITGSLDGYIR